MKKIGLICLALVLALGMLGVGYAMWSETLVIGGTVNTGSLNLEIVNVSWGEVGGDPDKNYVSWDKNDPAQTTYSCPAGYHFGDTTTEDKDVGYVTFNPVDPDNDGEWEKLEVTIHDAYPFYLANISFQVKNSGTVPLILQSPVITQDEQALVVEIFENWVQLHPLDQREIGFYVGVIQGAVENQTYSFTISITGVQWNMAQ